MTLACFPLCFQPSALFIFNALQLILHYQHAVRPETLIDDSSHSLRT
jgi:hypothetical protein